MTTMAADGVQGDGTAFVTTETSTGHPPQAIASVPGFGCITK